MANRLSLESNPFSDAGEMIMVWIDEAELIPFKFIGPDYGAEAGELIVVSGYPGNNVILQKVKIGETDQYEYTARRVLTNRKQRRAAAAKARKK